MAKGDSEYAALLEGMNRSTPECVDDHRFISDDLTEWDRVSMRGMCRVCPLRDLCQAYAGAAKPTGGFWAGKQRRGRGER